MNVYVWYNVISMFVNNMEWWSRHSIFKKRDTHVEIIRMCIVRIIRIVRKGDTRVEIIRSI